MSVELCCTVSKLLVLKAIEAKQTFISPSRISCDHSIRSVCYFQFPLYKLLILFIRTRSQDANITVTVQFQQYLHKLVEMK